jgi:glycosidase
MFPRQFIKNKKNLPAIDAMTAYLPELKKMGFNSVWINPILQPGDVHELIEYEKNHRVRIGNQVTKNLYAMHSAININPEFSAAPRDNHGNLTVSQEEANEIDRIAIKKFTDTAKNYGLAPIFDLVLNHVSSDAPICDTNPQWFKEVDPDFRDVRIFNYDDDQIRSEIIKEFWEPYIRRYMTDYGFDGVRVDDVGNLHSELRKDIYKLIQTIATDANKPQPVILDEVLFSNESAAVGSQKLRTDDVGPTHITTSTYYVEHDQMGHLGDLPQWTKNEGGVKASVVFQNADGSTRENAKGGCVNFSGSYKHHSLAKTILHEMAHEEMKKDPNMHALCQRISKTLDANGSIIKDEEIEIIFLHPYVMDIEKKIASGDEKIYSEVQNRMCEKIAICALSAGGGWFMLSGDETGDLTTLTNAGREHKAFSDSRTTITEQVITEMAYQIIQTKTISPELQKKLSHNGLAGAYGDLENEPIKQQRLLLAYIENIKNQINSGVPETCYQFKESMEKQEISFAFNDSDYNAKMRTPENGWLGQFKMKKFIANVNRLLASMPETKPGFWSEVITVPNKPNLLVVVRKNGLGFDSPTDLILIYLGQNKNICFTRKDLHEIAVAFQHRTIAKENRNENNPDFKNAYNCIMKASIHSDKAISLPGTKSRLTCYNQYPGLYENFYTMREDLPRIRELGFQQVWVNPFYTPCQVNPIPNMSHRVHSPYAMQNDKVYHRYAPDGDIMVKEYTSTAIDLGLTPIFDLVARHIAIDHQLVNGDPKLLKEQGIDTSKWFQRHPNGNLVMHNMDENYQPLGPNPWCDVAAFNYNDAEIKEQIIKYFWEPFIRNSIEELGFKGIRIDAPAMVPKEILSRLVDIANESCERKYGTQLIVIAETIGRGYMDENLALKGIMTHTMNSVFWMPGPEGGYGYEYSLWNKDDNWFTENKGMLQQVAPTVGFPGSHDEPRYMQQVKDKGITDHQTLDKRMKEKLATAAFASDGGWILQYGDEYGATKAVDVFKPIAIKYHKDKELQEFDHSEFIYSINRTLAKLSPPSFPEWTQRIFLKSNPDLVVFLVHQGVGFTGESFAIITNINSTKRSTLTQADINEITSANHRNPENVSTPKHLYLCGSVDPNMEVVHSIGEINIHKSETNSNIFSFKSPLSPPQNQEPVLSQEKKGLIDINKKNS